MARSFGRRGQDRKSTRLNSSHTEIYTLSLHDALPILTPQHDEIEIRVSHRPGLYQPVMRRRDGPFVRPTGSPEALRAAAPSRRKPTNETVDETSERLPLSPPMASTSSTFPASRRRLRLPRVVGRPLNRLLGRLPAPVE